MNARAIIVGLLLLAPACGNDGGTSTVAPTATSTAPAVAPTTTAATATSTTLAPTQTTRPPATTRNACALAAVGAGASSITTKPGDFDGNGAADVLRAYKLGNDWHLRVELAGGTTGHDLVVAGVDPGTGLKAVGGFGIDENAADEAFVVVGGGASTTIVGIFVFANCRLVRVTDKGNPAELAVGASALNRSGVSCVAKTALQTLSGVAPPATGTPFTVTRSTYDLVGTALVFANSSQSTIAGNDPALAASARFDCGGLTLS